MQKKTTRRWNDDWDVGVMAGVFAISHAKSPKPVEKRTEEAREHAHGPNLSMTMPTTAEKGYWPIMPLREALIKRPESQGVGLTHARTIVVS